MTAAAFVFARRFRWSGRPGWAIASLVAPPAYLVLGMAAFPLGDLRWLLAGGAVIWLWCSAVTCRSVID